MRRYDVKSNMERERERERVLEKLVMDGCCSTSLPLFIDLVQLNELMNR